MTDELDTDNQTNLLGEKSANCLASRGVRCCYGAHMVDDVKTQSSKTWKREGQSEFALWMFLWCRLMWQISCNPAVSADWIFANSFTLHYIAEFLGSMWLYLSSSILILGFNLFFTIPPIHPKLFHIDTRPTGNKWRHVFLAWGSLTDIEISSIKVPSGFNHLAHRDFLYILIPTGESLVVLC